jgi:hypothetical protein
LNPYLKFTGLAFQMAIIIAGAAYLGKYLDEKQQRDFPLFTMILSLVGVFVSLYIVIKEVIKMDKNS